jgi:hypothetical protein
LFDATGQADQPAQRRQRYLGFKQRLRSEFNDKIGVELEGGVPDTAFPVADDLLSGQRPPAPFLSSGELQLANSTGPTNQKV